jgi:hypothetical protein
MDTFKYRKEDEAREQNLKQFEAICRVEYEQNRVVLSQNSQKILPIPIQLVNRTLKLRCANLPEFVNFQYCLNFIKHVEE